MSESRLLTRKRFVAATAAASTAAVVAGIDAKDAAAGIGPNVFNVKDYGATGDNSTDDTAAIQAAVNAAYAQPGGGTVYLPNGNYRVTSIVKTLTSINGSLNIIGESVEGSILRKFGTSTTPILNFSNNVLDSHSLWRDFRIVGTNKAHVGIQTTKMSYMTFRNIHIESCSTAIYAVGTLISQWENCFLVTNGYGMQFRISPDLGTHPNLNTVRNCVISANTYIGIDYGDGQLLLVDNCDMEVNGTTSLNNSYGAIYIQPTVTNGAVNSAAPVYVRNTWFESNLGWNIQAYGGDLVVDGCYFFGSELGRCVYADGCQTVRCQDLCGGGATGGASEFIQATANTLFFYADGVRLSGAMQNQAKHSLVIGSQPQGVAPDYIEIGEHGGDVIAPAATKVVLYARDNGAGKAQLCARFNTGAVQVLAQQP